MPLSPARILARAAALAAAALLSAVPSLAGDAPPQPEAISAATRAELPARPIRIAKIVFSGTLQTIRALNETCERVKQAFAPHPVEILTLDFDKLEAGVVDETIDAFIASAGFYWRLTNRGVISVGTLISPREPDPNNGTALAVLVRNDNLNVARIADLKGMRLGATYPSAFMSYRIGMAEIAHMGYDPDRFFSEVKFLGRAINEPVIGMLDRGEVDAAMIRACWLEEQPPDVQSRYRVLDPKKGGVLCQHSTRTYPNIMFAVTQSAAPTVAHTIAKTLLTTRDLSAGYRWGLATDMRAVDRVHRELKVEQYAYLREPTLRRWAHEHWPWLVFAAAFVVGLALHNLRTEALVRRRTAQLRETMQEKERNRMRADALRERMEKLHKATVVGQLSSMIAHELAQPLAALQYYCEGQKELLSGETPDAALLEESRAGMQAEIARARAIVERVRSYNRGTTRRDLDVALEPTLQGVLNGLSSELLRRTHVTVSGATDITVKGDSLEISLLLSNLLKNALQAACEADDPHVRVDCARVGSRVRITIENSGKPIPDDRFLRLRTPFLTTKETGLGLGISIATALAEASGGHLEFSRPAGGGLTATITLNE